MTVICLSDNEKADIAYLFVQLKAPATELAEQYAVSRRTIIRALEEQGIDPGVKHRTPKLTMSQIGLKEHYIEAWDDLNPPPMDSLTWLNNEGPVPWYRRLQKKLMAVYNFVVFAD